jgi:outer membrane protein TolC
MDRTPLSARRQQVAALALGLALLAPLARAQVPATPAPASSPGAAAAQQPLPEMVSKLNRRVASLRDALDLAARQGPDVAAARAQAAITGAGVERAWNAWKPDLAASGQFDHTSTPSVLDFAQFAGAFTSFTNLALTPGKAAPAPLTLVGQNSVYGTVQLSQPLFNPQGLFLIGPANRARDAAALGADESREQVLLGVVRAYMGTKGLYGLLEAAEDAERVALRREDDARARIAAGTAVEVDLLRAQNDSAVARVNIANIQGQILTLLPLLEALTGEPLAPDNGAAIDPDLGAPADAASEPWERAFSLQSAVQQVASAAGALRYDHFQWLPSVQGIARGNYNSNAGFTGKKYTYDLIIAASIPLYDRGQRYSAQHEDEARLAGAQANLASVRARARSSWLGARANLAAAEAVLAQSEAQVQFARRAQAQIDASARAGVATSLDLSDADNRAFQAASGLAQARAALEVRRAEVAAAEGRLYSALRK